MRHASIEYPVSVTWRMTWINYSMFVIKESPTINGEVRRILSIWISNIRRERKVTLQWRQNERNYVSNHQPHDCLINRSFRRRSKKISKLRVTGFVRRIHRWPVNSTHKGPVTRKCFHLMTSSWQYENRWKTPILISWRFSQQPM